MSDQPDLTLEDRYVRFVLLTLTGLAAIGLALAYSRSQQAAAEIAMLEAIPVLAEDPDSGDGPR